MRRTKIVCTIGPASDSPEVLEQLIAAGMDVARLNFSHGTHEEHARRIRIIRELSERLGKPVAILQDLSGPKLRIGAMAREVFLTPGQPFRLTTRDIIGNEREVSIPLETLPRCLEPGNRLYLNDGIIELLVTATSDTEIETVVRAGGPLNSHKGLSIPDVSIDVAPVTPKDLDDLDFGIREGVDWVAASFVRAATDLAPLRERMMERGARIPILAKIEKHEAVSNLTGILDVADGAMVARGDLGIEVSIDQVPLIQKNIIARCNVLAKPVITATEMLDSMHDRPRPTRAEVTDVANAIFDGTDCVMLSRETATGRFPVEAVRMMDRIAVRTESSMRYQQQLRDRPNTRAQNVTDAVGEAVRDMANDLNVAAVVPATTSGYTARIMAKYRPLCPIIAVSHRPETVRRLALTWGTLPMLSGPVHSTDEMLREAIASALQSGLVKNGDLVIISAGVPAATAGQTNLIKVERVGSSGEAAT
ncbi:MAG: pyruvate kinase [Armatimonadetes bacterium]|jgi:pyruvate kinase|nr:pyruvate kinase [Armatimonadota bacterium]